MVLILGILGSPRPQGNAALLLQTFLKGAKDAGAETTSLNAASMDIAGCTACNACQDTGVCAIGDDMSLIYDSIRNADVLVLATPLYFSGMSSQMKAVIDRCQCLWQEVRRGKVADLKYGYLLAVGAMENANFKNVLSEVRSFYIGIGIEYHDAIFVPGVESDGDIISHQAELERAYQMGRAAASKTT